MDKSYLFSANIAQSLDPSFGLPPDVSFKIVSSGNELKAHKYVLALASPVFKRQFFGDLKEPKGVIPVEQTTEKSFQTMIHFAYGKEIDWDKFAVEELFDVANMAEKYHIDALTKEVKKAVEKVIISEDNVVTIAATAQEFCQFEEISKTLLLHCTKFLKSTLKNPNDFVTFARKHVNTNLSETAFSLISMFSEVSITQNSCGVCGKECRKGKVVLDWNTIAIGEKLAINPATNWECAFKRLQAGHKEGRVTSKTHQNIISVQLSDGSNAEYYVVNAEVPVFLYDCC